MQLPCPRCGETHANVAADLSTGADFRCLECDGGFARADLEAIIARWRVALRWLDAMPTQDQVDATAEVPAGGR
jgi:transposase